MDKKMAFAERTVNVKRNARYIKRTFENWSRQTKENRAWHSNDESDTLDFMGKFSGKWRLHLESIMILAMITVSEANGHADAYSSSAGYVAHLAIRPGEGQDFLLWRIVDNAVTMQRVCRIAYRFRHPVTYFPIELEEALVRTRTAPFSARTSASSSEGATRWRLPGLALLDRSTQMMSTFIRGCYFLRETKTF